MKIRLLIYTVAVAAIAYSCTKSAAVQHFTFSDEYIPNKLSHNVPDIRLISSVYAESGIELIGSCKSYEVPGCDYYFLYSNDAEDFSKAVRIDATHYSKDIYKASFEPPSEGRCYLRFCADNNGLSYIQSEPVRLNYSKSGIANTVDLDLPSGIMWSILNLGAASFEKSGDHFAWGETAPKTFYSWENYKWCNGTSDSLTKYCDSSEYGEVDGKDVLEAEDDAASVLLGGKWRMPQENDFLELVGECSWLWKTFNGVDGILFTSDHNANGIFLPCSGDRRDYSSYSPNAPGNYWSSNIYFQYPFYASELYFSPPPDYYIMPRMDPSASSIRCAGNTIRPVWDASTAQ